MRDDRTVRVYGLHQSITNQPQRAAWCGPNHHRRIAMHDDTPDTRRSIETVFKMWLYDKALFPEEKRRLADCAREILENVRDDWRQYDDDARALYGGDHK